MDIQAELGHTLQVLARRLDHMLLEADISGPSEDLDTLRLLTTDAMHALQALVEAEEARTHGAPQLDRALRRMASDFAMSTGASADVRICGDIGRVPNDVADVVLCVARETFCNISRDARSTIAVVTLAVDGGHVSIDITDDGVDLPQRQVPAWGSTVDLGLCRVRRAVAASHGLLVVRSLRPRGLRMQAVVPLGTASPL